MTEACEAERALSGEIQVTYSSIAGEQGKLVFVVLPKPTRKPVRRIKLGFKKNVFTVRVLSRKTSENNFFVLLI